jgi:hypothetical protein
MNWYAGSIKQQQLYTNSQVNSKAASSMSQQQAVCTNSNVKQQDSKHYAPQKYNNSSTKQGSKQPMHAIKISKQ